MASATATRVDTATASASIFAERAVSVPREVLMMFLFRHFGASFVGWKYLSAKYPARVNLGKMTNEKRVYELLSSLTNDELTLEFASMTKPTPSYLEAAGLCEEIAAEVHAGESNEQTLGYLARQGIIPAQFAILAESWWNRQRRCS